MTRVSFGIRVERVRPGGARVRLDPGADLFLIEAPLRAYFHRRDLPLFQHLVERLGGDAEQGRELFDGEQVLHWFTVTYGPSTRALTALGGTPNQFGTGAPERRPETGWCGSADDFLRSTRGRAGPTL